MNIEINLFSNLRNKIERDGALEPRRSVHGAALIRHKCQIVQTNQIGDLHHQVARDGHLVLNDGVEYGEHPIHFECFRTDLD